MRNSFVFAYATKAYFSKYMLCIRKYNTYKIYYFYALYNEMWTTFLLSVIENILKISCFDKIKRLKTRFNEIWNRALFARLHDVIRRVNFVLVDIRKTGVYLTLNRCIQDLNAIAKEQIFYLVKLNMIVVIFQKLERKLKLNYFENYEIVFLLQIISD